MQTAAEQDPNAPWPADFVLSNEELTGFPSPGDDIGLSAHLYIAAIARSGSTFLGNLLTMPPTHWVMMEPWFVNGATARRLWKQAVGCGFEVGWEEWMVPAEERRKERFLERYRTLLAPLLQRLEKWGAKEVRPQFHEPTIATIRPRKVVVLVRSIGDVYLSLLERSYKDEPGRYTERWAREYCGVASRTLVAMADSASGPGYMRVVRYEDLMDCAEERRSLETWLDWPLGGDPERNLDMLGRRYERFRHAESAPASLTAAERGLPEFVGALAARLAEECRPYQQRFDY
ncbi:MAG: hypothetical protein ACRED5_03045 [Propylenella sp.]